jgi:hypothetical protein
MLSVNHGQGNNNCGWDYGTEDCVILGKMAVLSGLKMMVIML